jgi:hypothetical protein
MASLGWKELNPSNKTTIDVHFVLSSAAALLGGGRENAH